MAPRQPVWALRGLARGASLAAFTGLTAGAAAAETIVAAEFFAPTDAYQHCVLGDCIEYSGLQITVELADGTRVQRSVTTQPDAFVFEDFAPRLWDITGDGAPEVVVILSGQSVGASLAVFGPEGLLVQTDPIGQPNRWLSPVGAADFDGDGRIEVAFVDRPHLAKTLRVFEWDGAGLRLDTEISGLSNHRIGQDFISGGVRDCGQGPEMVTANGEWSEVMITGFEDGAWVSRVVGAFSGDRLAAVLGCRG